MRRLRRLLAEVEESSVSLSFVVVRIVDTLPGFLKKSIVLVLDSTKAGEDARECEADMECWSVLNVCCSTGSVLVLGVISPEVSF